MKSKIENLKEKLKNLEHAAQLNLALQQELINSKEKTCNKNKVIPDSLKRLSIRITPKLSDDEVRKFLHIISSIMFCSRIHISIQFENVNEIIVWHFIISILNQYPTIKRTDFSFREC